MLKQFYNFLKPSGNIPQLYFWMLVFVVVSLPVSPFLTTVALIATTVAWLITGNLKQKMKNLNNKALFVFLLLFFVHIFWLLNTNDLAHGLKNIKIKIPLLLFPLIIATSAKIGFREIRTITLFASATLLVSFGVSISIYYGWWERPFTDTRQISIYISHIRLVLLLNLNIFILLYFVLFHQKKISRLEVFVYPLIIILLLCYIYLLRSLTGIFLFAILTALFAIYYYQKKKTRKQYYTLLLVVLLVVSGTVAYFAVQVNRFYNTEKPDITKLPDTTAYGNKYKHDLNDKIIENGHFRGLYISESEMRKAWNEVSDFGFDSVSSKGYKIKFVLQRYLTSKGLRKDYDGVKQLLANDVHAIERGISNYRFLKPYNPDVIIYQIIWQFDAYSKTGNPSGYSIAQRIEYLKTGWEIWKNNTWFGVGTGDVEREYLKQYQKQNTQLQKRYRLVSHNQYLWFLVSFGIVGFLLSIMAFIYPIYIKRHTLNFYFYLFVIIAFLSMLNEDTLLTQAGVTFVAYYYSLFLFGIDKKRL